MNNKNNNNPSLLDFKDRIAQTEAELKSLKEESWKEISVKLHDILSFGNPTPEVRESCQLMLQTVWSFGYSSGATNMAKYLACSAGAGDIVKKVEAYQEAINSNPINN